MDCSANIRACMCGFSMLHGDGQSALKRSNSETRGSLQKRSPSGQTDVAANYCKLAKQLSQRQDVANPSVQHRLATARVLLLECLVSFTARGHLTGNCITGKVAGHRVAQPHLLIALHSCQPPTNTRNSESGIPLLRCRHACHCHKILYHRQLVAMDGPLPSIAFSRLCGVAHGLVRYMILLLAHMTAV